MANKFTFDGKTYELTFEDNFEGNALDTTKWALCPETKRGDIGGSWNNAMTEVHDGNLWLWAKIGKDGLPISGAVRTLGLFEQAYGYFEARMCFPRTTGFWCAFWMMCGNVGKVDGSAVSGVEIDIIETGDCATGGINHALHWDGYGKDLKTDAYLAHMPELYDGGWHTFALAWTKTEYVFLIDGKETWRTSKPGICEHPGYMKLTEEFGTWAAPLVPEQLPAACRIDWVRAYRLVEE